MAVTYGPYPTLDEAEKVSTAHYAMCDACQFYGEIAPQPAVDVDANAYIGEGTDSLLAHLLQLDTAAMTGEIDSETLLSQVLLLLAIGTPHMFTLTGADTVFPDHVLTKKATLNQLVNELTELADLATFAYQLNRNVIWC